MGNGQKAQHKRERNAAKAGKGATSQLKANAKAQTVICQTCRQTFLCTIRAKALTEHSENKHGKPLDQCFPGFVEIAT
ncbi:DUF1909-domain-containing protein [Basidiobolus meristosporus CBS 931.73]|uniref:DUF1909-domain-containing protein n=1 Tax=Basidiobolus meristosporus CBS 931.73 TaxID=1314790 RepID=A0A1Y1ZBX6_9FUNG|nr:DUF1909-domain-containing protein [Basidiobolus meristosporus CBS 931.73]|eukprot:ORY07759.1 DUF1909-domain-containing protein [Basidiobolus meristosporus CBS 931.73]